MRGWIDEDTRAHGAGIAHVDHGDGQIACNREHDLALVFDCGLRSPIRASILPD